VSTDVSKEVIIIGAGVVGCATAYFLALEGIGVTVVDPNGIAAAASGRNNGLIEHPYDAETAGLYEETVELLSDVLGAGFPSEPAGTLLLTHDERTARELRQHYAQFPSLRPQALNADQAREAEPLLAEGLCGCMLHTGYPIMPVEATTAFADLARAAGADFVLGEPLALVREGEQVRGVSWSGTQHLTDAVLVCAGAGTAQVVDGLVDPSIITPLWGVIVSIELPRRPRHPLIEGALAIAQGGGEIKLQAPFTLLDSPSWLAVGSTMLEGAEPDRERWAPTLLERGREFVPSLAQAEVKDVLACARPRSFDNRPILGLVPGQEHLWIAAGHGGRGMSIGPASARLVADAIVAGDGASLPSPLSASRLRDQRF
jgi:glycine/D-amino acid oxidase-like deaminating enzyme